MRTDGIYGFYPLVPDAAWAIRMLSLGVRTLQLRVKDKPPALLRDEIARTLQVAQDHNAQIVINDHWREAIDLGACYVHLGQDDLDTADCDALRQAGISFGISTHSDDELERALSHDPAYIALGPIYPPTGKQVDWAPQGLSRLAEWRARIEVPLIAIGGITLETAPQVLDAGADSIAVIGDVLHHPHPDQRTHAWLQFFSSRS